MAHTDQQPADKLDPLDDYMDDGDWEDDEELFVVLPEEGGFVRKIAVGLLVAVLLIGVLFGGAFLWLQRQIDPPGEPGPDVVFVIPEGATASQIARLLEDQKVVSNATIFRMYAEWKEADSFQAGKYDGLHQNDSMDDVLKRLAKPPLPPIFFQFTIPEGLWLADIKPLILEKFPKMNATELDAALLEVKSKYQPADQSFLPPDKPRLEGLLFPDTYQVGEEGVSDEKALVQQLVDTMDKHLDELGYADAAARVGLEPYQVLVIASLVEEEAKTDGDRPKIARVIYNRIAKEMKLEIDATVPYALGQHKQELTADDLAVDSPWNTRKNKGIPPSPIAAPGRASLEAALNPEAGDWLYYVLADAEGNHFFTSSYNEFLKAKQRAQDAGLF